jgi:hypothetical protein
MSVVPNVPNLAEVPKALAVWVQDVVEILDKPAAFVWGLLATAGVVGVPAGPKLGGGALLAFALGQHLAENLLKKS